MSATRDAAPAPREETLSGCLALVVCGALMKEVQHIAETRGWSADFFGVPARYHTQPRRIVESVEAMLDRLDGRYERVVVVYGDCGTSGKLDRLLEERGVSRILGPHCYEMYAGSSYEHLTREKAGTYFITDYLVRKWESTILAETDPAWRESYTATMFAGFDRMVYLQQEPNEVLNTKALQIAESIGLPLETRPVGMGELETRLVEEVEGARTG